MQIEGTEKVGQFYHFYRCASCRQIRTADDETKAKSGGQFCDCGANRFSPCNPTRAEWALPAIEAYCRANDLEPNYGDE